MATGGRECLAVPPRDPQKACPAPTGSWALRGACLHHQPHGASTNCPRAAKPAPLFLHPLHTGWGDSWVGRCRPRVSSRLHPADGWPSSKDSSPNLVSVRARSLLPPPRVLGAGEHSTQSGELEQKRTTGGGGGWGWRRGLGTLLGKGRRPCGPVRQEGRKDITGWTGHGPSVSHSSPS